MKSPKVLPPGDLHPGLNEPERLAMRVLKAAPVAAAAESSGVGAPQADLYRRFARMPSLPVFVLNEAALCPVVSGLVAWWTASPSERHAELLAEVTCELLRNRLVSLTAEAPDGDATRRLRMREGLRETATRSNWIATGDRTLTVLIISLTRAGEDVLRQLEIEPLRLAPRRDTEFTWKVK